MDEIKDIIKNVIEGIAEKRPNNEEKIERVWANILNKKELEHTNLVGLKDGQIFAHVDSPAWLYQMNIKKRKILDRLKEEFSDIKSISFKIGKTK